MSSNSWRNNESNIGIQGSVANSTVNLFFGAHGPTDDKDGTPGRRYYDVPQVLCNNFMGQESNLRKISRKLVLSSACQDIERKHFILYGLGGSGKTQVSVHFADMHKKHFDGVFWVNGSTLESATRSYARVAQVVGVGHGENVENDCTQGKNWLASSGKWLLILDNADDRSISVHDLLPPGNSGCVLVTTRNADFVSGFAKPGMSIRLESISVEYSIKLLLANAGKADVTSLEARTEAELVAAKIVTRLGCLPLAIVQAGATIRQRLSGRLGDYLKEYERDHTSLMALNLPHENSVYTTLEVSRRLIESSHSEIASHALDILDVTTCLLHEEIPGEIFKARRSKVSSSLQTVASYIPGAATLTKAILEKMTTPPINNLTGRALVLLSSYSIISFVDKENHIFSMHRLVSDWARSNLRNRDRWWSSRSHWAKATTLSRLSDSITESRDSSEYTLRRLLYPHVKYYCEHNQDLSSITDVQALSKFAFVLSEYGSFSKAKELYQSALDLMTGSLDQPNLEMLTVIHKTAVTLRELGHYDQAELMSKRALAGRTAILGEDHPETMESTRILALSMQGNAKFLVAKDLMQQLIHRRKQLTGVERLEESDSVMAEILGNLASVHEALGEYKQAVNLSRVAYEIRDTKMGSDHPETLRCAEILASNLYLDGTDRRAAEEMSRKVLKWRVEILGPMHPDTLTSMHALAWGLFRNGQFEDALKMHKTALDGRQKVLGLEHPDTMVSFTDLAEVLLNRDQKQAEDLYRKALASFEELLKPEHPYILILQNNLAVLMKKQGQYEEAEYMYRKTMSGWEERSESRHPQALLCESNLAMLLLAQKRMPEAESTIRRALIGYKQTLGASHYETLMTSASLARILEHQSKLEEAEELIRTAVDGLEKCEGQNSPTTCNMVARLGSITLRRGLHSEALSHFTGAQSAYESIGIDCANFRWFLAFQELRENWQASEDSGLPVVGDDSKEGLSRAVPHGDAQEGRAASVKCLNQDLKRQHTVNQEVLGRKRRKIEGP